MRLNLRELRAYYIVFSTAIFCVLGLVFSYKLVEMAFLDVLITHINQAMGESMYDLRIAAVLGNFEMGVSAASALFFTYLAEVHTGRYKMVVFSALASIVGLILSYGAASNAELNFRLFYPSLLVMAIAQGAMSVTLEAFLYDQIQETDDDEDRRRSRTKFWWLLVSFVAAIFSAFVAKYFTFKRLAVALALMMGVSFVVFVSGTRFYNFVATVENPLREVRMVITRAIQNKNAYYSSDTQILPHVPWLRWLDKAATTQGPEQVGRVKRLLKMLPLWSCFLTLSLVLATGDTFFVIEATSLVDEFDLTPIVILINLASVTEFVVSIFSRFVIRKLSERMQFNEQKMELVRIGIGMGCSVPLCLTAWAISMLRMNPDMNVYWLAHQYILLGVTAGLCGDGFRSLFKTQSFESLISFGPPLGELARGLGEFLSIPSIYVFSNAPFEWIKKDLEHSHLDRYYLLMAGLSAVNVFIYCLVFYWYADEAFLVGDGGTGLMDEPILWFPPGLGEDAVGDVELGVTGGPIHGEPQDAITLEDEEMTTGDRLMEDAAPGSDPDEQQEVFLAREGERGIVEGLIGLMEDAAPGPDEQQEVFPTGDVESDMVEDLIALQNMISRFM